MSDAPRKSVGEFLSDMEQAEERHVIRQREEPLACRICRSRNGPSHSKSGDLPDYVCPVCRGQFPSLGDV